MPEPRVYEIKVGRKRSSVVVSIVAPSVAQAIEFAMEEHPAGGTTFQCLGSKGPGESPLVSFGGSS